MSPRRLLALSFVTLTACAPAAEPAAPPPAATAPPSAVASAAPAPEATPSARVVEMQTSRESALYWRAKIVFSNPTRRACKFLGYKAVWPTFNKTIHLEGLAVPPGETRERWLKIDEPGGDKLTAADARVEVQVDCAP